MRRASISLLALLTAYIAWATLGSTPTQPLPAGVEKPHTEASTVSVNSPVRTSSPSSEVTRLNPAPSSASHSIPNSLTPVRPLSKDSAPETLPAQELLAHSPNLSRSLPLPTASNRIVRDAPAPITLVNRVRAAAAARPSTAATTPLVSAAVPSAVPIPVPAVLAPDLSPLSLSTEQLIEVHTLADEFIEQIGNTAATQPEDRAALSRNITLAAQTTEQRYRQLYGDFALAALRRLSYAQLAPPESTP